MKLFRALSSLGGPSFASSLRGELAEREDELPLRELCASGGYPKLDDLTVDAVAATPERVNVRLTVFFSETIPAGCSTRVESRVTVVALDIDRRTGEAHVRQDSPTE